MIMTSNKPKIIIEQQYEGDCLHLLVKVSDKRQIRYLLSFLSRFIKHEKNKKVLKFDLNDIFAFDKTVLFSVRLYDKDFQISYLAMDEGKVSKRADFFFVITGSKEKFQKLIPFKYENYFELY